MIEEAYVSFEVAKLLKEKGFDEDCRYFYDCATPNTGYLSNKRYGEYIHNSKVVYDGRNLAACPTHQMVMAWLMEVYNIYIEIYVIKNYDKKICEYTYTIMDLNFPGSDDGIDCCNKYKTHKQACEAALKYCLENLI